MIFLQAVIKVEVKITTKCIINDNLEKIYFFSLTIKGSTCKFLFTKIKKCSPNLQASQIETAFHVK